MCIISGCPKGTLKSGDYFYNFIKQGFENNKQGSGYMFKKENEHKVYFNKGFFNLDELIKDLDSHNLGINDELVIHHRISTHGLVNEQNSHPYVISDNFELITKTNGYVKKPIMAHNGQFRNILEYVNKNPQYSDTFAFAHYFLSDKNIMNLFKTNVELFKFAFKDILGLSKIAILFPNDDLKMFGEFIKDEKGYYHSNEGYCKVRYDYGGRTVYEDKREVGFLIDRRFNHNKYYDMFDEHGEYNPDLDNDIVVNVNIKNESKIKETNSFDIFFDGLDMMIDEFNFSHFKYIKEVDYYNHTPNKYFVIKDFDRNAENNIARNIATNEYYAISTKVLDCSYLYFPINADYRRIYKDFLDLKKYGQSVINNKMHKRLCNILKRCKKREEPTDLMFYHKHNEYFTRLSLELYKEWVENVYSNKLRLFNSNVIVT